MFSCDCLICELVEFELQLRHPLIMARRILLKLKREVVKNSLLVG